MTTITAGPRTAAAFRRTAKHRIRRGVVGGLTASLLAVAGLGVTAEPASAASYVTGCFKFASPYNGAYSNDHASLSLFSNGSWVAVASTTTDYNGCAAFNISGSWRNYPAKLTAMRRVGPAIFTGQTPLYAFGGSQRSDLGTGIVYCYGCL